MPVFTRFHMGPFVEVIVTICSNGFAQLNNMVAMPIYGKTLKNLLQNEEIFEAESWYVASETQGVQICSNDDPRMTFDLFMTLSNFFPSCCGYTGRISHGICRYAMAILLR